MKEIGQRLRDARVKKGLSLEDVAEQTRIRQRYLLAMEEGDFGSIPGIVYVKGFLKQYAQTVGLNPQEMLDQFQRYAGENSPELANTKQELKPLKPVAPATKTRKVNVKKIVITTVVLVLMVALAYNVARFISILKDETLPQLRDPGPSVENQTQAEGTNAGQAGTTVQNGTGTVASNPNVTVSDGKDAVTPDSLYAKQQAAQGNYVGGNTSGTTAQNTPASGTATGQTTQPQTGTGTIGTTTPNGTTPSTGTTTTNPATSTNSPNTTGTNYATTPGTTTPNTAGTQAPTTGQPATGLTQTAGNTTPMTGQEGAQFLQLTAKDKAWVRVLVDGKKAYEDTMEAGAIQNFTGKTFSVRSGNAGAVEVSYNGVSQGSLGKPGDVVTRTFGE